MEVLYHVKQPDQAMEGIIGDEVDDHEVYSAQSLGERRWTVRLTRAGLQFAAREIHGFKFTSSS